MHKSVAYPKESLLASEIAEQPLLWPTTLELILAAGSKSDLVGLPVLLTGAGTSAYAASAVAEGWPGSRAIPTTDLLLQSTVEIQSAFPSVLHGALLISFARSGNSPESVAVVEKFKRYFPLVRHLAIVCDASGKLAHMQDIQVICLDPRTNDQSLAMTGSFSNLALAGLCLRRSEEVTERLEIICKRTVKRLPELSRQIQEISRFSEDRVVVLTSGMQALAKESALKIVELTAGRVMAMAETFLGFRHGPIGFLRKDTPVLCFLSSDPAKRQYEDDLIEYLRERSLGKLILVGDTKAQPAGQNILIAAVAPDLPDELRTPFEIVIAQLLAYHLSVHSRVDPDNPSPDGAITRVVRAFRIHDDFDGGSLR